MIDLRSDTLTKPTNKMMRAIQQAKLGDDGRVKSDGKGEDPTVNHLERMAANIVGKEAALFCSSGTMANVIAVLTHTKRGEAVAVDVNSHIFQNGRAIFTEDYFGRKAMFYESDKFGRPLTNSLRDLLLNQNVTLLCLENTFAHKGGTCLTVQETVLLCKTAAAKHTPVHLDGARIFNAAAHLNVPVNNLVEPATTVQICLSKGLGAPIGSMLCGSRNFIQEARKIRKLIGGGMRQAGIVAAAGIEALKNHQVVKEDNERALLLANEISQPKHQLFYLNDVQSNILIIDLSPGPLLATDVQNELANRGLLVRAISDKKIRMIIHRDITENSIKEAATTINTYFTSIDN